MHLKQLEIDSFRNLEKTVIAFDDGFNLLTGRNAQGKSNFLEALYCLSLGKSYRTTVENDLLRFGADFSRLSGIFTEGGVDYRLEIIWDRTSGPIKKTIKFNTSSLSRLSDFIDKAPMVMLSPEDLELVTGPPDKRRRFLDLLCSRVYPAYTAALREYRKLLDARNHWLKAPYNRQDREVGRILTEKVCELGAEILSKRFEILSIVRPVFAGIYEKIFNAGAPVIRYRSSVKDIKDKNADEIETSFKSTLDSLHERELFRKFTMAGPHRDDFSLKQEGKNLKKFGSMGEIRSAAVVLKMTEADVIREKSGKEPVILIDDSLNEFDPVRISQFLESMTGSRQVFYATTDKFPEILQEDGLYRFTVRNGEISQCHSL